MKKFYAFYPKVWAYLTVVFMLTFFTATHVTAQNWTIAVCSGGPPSSTTSNTYGPMYSVATANATNRIAVIYPSSQLTTLAGKLLTSAYFHRTTASGAMLGSPNFKIYLKEVSAVDWGSTALDWATATTGATLVYDGNPVSSVGSSAGWKGFTFSNNFSYSGTSNLAVFLEYTNATASNAISWSYEYTTSCVNTGNSNTTKYSNVTTGTLPTSLGTGNYRRPYIGFDFTNPTCVNPPTPGTIVSSLNPACSGAPFTLSLTGGTYGANQTYQWQSSSDSINWNDINGATNATYSSSQVANTFYRVQVTCGATVTSSPIKLVTPSLIRGVFTINNNQPTGGTNFASFTEAINYIRCGIDSAVVFNVVPNSGPYNEEVIIPYINGSSSVKHIKINGNGATITVNAPSSQKTAFTLSGAKHITIDSVTIDGTNSTYAWGVLLTNQADSNVIKNCTINLNPTTTTSAYHIGIVSSGSSSPSTAGNNSNGNIITGNTIKGGYYGIYLYGSTTPYNKRNTITNNIVQDFYAYGIYAYGQDSILCSKNDVSRPTRTGSATTAAGLYLVTSTTVLAEKNQIHNVFDAMPSSTAAFYGIYLSGSGTATQPNQCLNNMVYGINGASGTQYGIYSISNTNWQFYHNTIVLDNAASTAGTTYGMYVYGSGVYIKNNIVYITRGGSGTKYCLYFSTTGVAECNKNVLYMNSGSGTNGIGYFSSAKTSLTDWQGTGYDLNSSNANPAFAGTTDFTPTEPVINNMGQTGLGVTTDIFGTVRGSSPDPGAIEFSIAGVDAGLTWVSPGMPVSAGSKTITISVTNNASTGNINSINVSYTDGNIIQTEDFTGLNIAPTASQNISFTTPYNLTSNTTLTAYVNFVNGTADVSPTNDTVRQSLCFALKGAYTINAQQTPSATNFTSFNALATALNCGGLDSAIVVSVEPGTGPYNERFALTHVSGASSTNTITIKGNGETLAYNSSDASNRSAIVLNGADYIIIDSLNIDVSTGTYGWGILFTNAANNNIIKKCTITNNITSTTSLNNVGIIMNGSGVTSASTGNNGNNNQILNNTIIGGYYGIYLYGSTSTYNKRNSIRDNVVKDFYSYAIYAYGNDSLTVSKNDVSRPTRTTSTTTSGVYASSVTNLLVEKNRVHNMFDGMPSSTSSCYGLYLVTSGSSNTAPNRCENNLIYNINSNTGIVYGIYSSGYNNWNYYHNTIVLDNAASTAGTTYGMYVSGTDVNVKNNIVYVSRGGTGTKYCFYYSTAGVSKSNNNVLYMGSTAGTNNIGYLGAAKASFADWIASGNDSLSVLEDPLFVGNGDYTPTNFKVNSKGTAVGVATDILDSARNFNTPDAGAIEFTTQTSGINMAAVKLEAPVATAKGCYTSAEQVKVKVYNASVSTIDFSVNPVIVKVEISGAINKTITDTLTSGTLASDSTLIVTFDSTVNMSVTGAYTFNAYTVVDNDANTANDAITPVTITRNALTPGTANANPSSYCVPSPANITLNADGTNGYTSVQWKQSVSSSAEFTSVTNGTTLPYTVTTPLTQTNYYKLFVYCGTEVDSSAAITVAYANPQIISTVTDTVCGTGKVTLEATASSGATISWFSAATGGTPIGTGSPFTPVDPISTNTTYYVAASNGQSSAYVGKAAVESDAGTGGGLTSYINFDAISSFTLKTVDIYPYGATTGTVTIELRTATGTSIMSKTVAVTGATTPSAANVQTVTLDFPVVGGASYRLGVSAWTGVTNLYRDGTNINYPYTLPGVISITSSSLASWYYFFYNWQISTGCESARTPVIGYVDNSPTCSTLPVSGLELTGQNKNGINQLKWQTLTEVNNRGFEIQRSADGINFTKIDFVNSLSPSGNSSDVLSYTFDDSKPFSTVSYYRLKQIDKDGKWSYSNIIMLRSARSNKLEITQIYPNPVVNKLNVVVSSPEHTVMRMMITDITGKLIKQETRTVTAGDNRFTIDVSGLSQGTYLIKAICNEGCENAVQKFVK